MYSLIGPLLEGKYLYLVTIPSQPSIIIDMDLSLLLALSVVGLFLFVSRLNSKEGQMGIFLIIGLALAISAYLIQTYLSIWFPDLFVTGNWYTFRNSLATILTYTAILIGAMVPAVYLVPRLRLTIGYRYLILFFTALGTATLYNSYLNTVMMTPGSNISMPEWILAVSPFIAAVAVATGIFGFFLVLREVFDHGIPLPGRIALVTALTVSAFLLTFATAVAVYAVITSLILTKDKTQIHPVIIAAGITGIALASGIAGSYFGAMGPDIGQYVPVWIFPILCLALLTLVPAIRKLPLMDAGQRIFIVFSISWMTGMAMAIVALQSPAGILEQPDILPQTPISLMINFVLGICIAGILYRVLPEILRIHGTRMTP